MEVFPFCLLGPMGHLSPFSKDINELIQKWLNGHQIFVFRFDMEKTKNVKGFCEKIFLRYSIRVCTGAIKMNFNVQQK